MTASNRKRGIGRTLLAHAEAWAAQHGHSVVRLWSSSTRREAHAFYERVGYTNIKTQYTFVKTLDAAGPTRLRGFIPEIGP